MHVCDHFLYPAIRIDSPNCNDRPLPDDISLLVIHCISLPPEQFGGPYIDQLFCNQLHPEQHDYFKEIAHLQVSAHLLIRRDGEIRQYVPFHRRAWHAGVSAYQGRGNCNDFSIGIELEGSVTTTYTDAQYQRLAEAVCALLAAYPKLSRQAIVGHSDIAPGRKADPGEGFDWRRLRALLDGAEGGL